jgi:hypothetical protein
MIPDNTPSYIGRGECGCLFAAVVDDPAHRRDTARSVAQMIRDGLAVERSTVQYVRDNWKHCPHQEPEVTQLSLETQP